MTEFNKVFLDTQIFIYFLEDNEQFGEQANNIFRFFRDNDVELISSVLTYMEFCVRPFELKKHDLIDTFKEFLKEIDVFLLNIDFKIAELAAQLRSKYKGLRGMDAIQIATAIYSNCDSFMTNDKKLKSMNEIEITLIGDWQVV